MTILMQTDAVGIDV